MLAKMYKAAAVLGYVLCHAQGGNWICHFEYKIWWE